LPLTEPRHLSVERLNLSRHLRHARLRGACLLDIRVLHLAGDARDALRLEQTLPDPVLLALRPGDRDEVARRQLGERPRNVVSTNAPQYVLVPHGAWW
jgi:hypothetical protein